MAVKNVIIPNKKELEKSKKIIVKGGAQKLHVVSDFNRTLTTAFFDGKSVPSLISVLRDGNYLTSGYAHKAQALYDKYHPFEIDPKIPKKEKKKLMQEWWTTHFALLIKSGLNKKDLERVVLSNRVKFRNGFSEFIDILKKNSIPLVIISSDGLGGDGISMYLKKEKKLYDNIYIVSNSYEWGRDGGAVAVKKPIIHAMNKDETSVKDFPFFKKIKDRKNVLLLGDSLDDIGMVAGFHYDNLIKIGFLNENVKENMEYYKHNYDAIILNDSSMDFINKLLKGMVKQK
jgi:5'-nucleotidase